ncbi:hypothetical protein [Marinicellulosiphila megalodicopiae]|uniref:hypothetical protein n=1 Tax=Marinicellulosiphila megalodicopiae TaxID=2724896 RepID=UPI003BAF9854
MVLFWPIQNDLDCINDQGSILGRIKFNAAKDQHIFYPASETIILSSDDKSGIAQKLMSLDSGESSIPLQDDD